MTILMALGGNAIASRDRSGEEAQRAAIHSAAVAVGEACLRHDVVITHGNGPHVGLLAMQAANAGNPVPLDVLGAETEGMLGYWIERELREELGGREVAALLTQVEVREDDPAFSLPSKPIGPSVDKETADRLTAELGWTFGAFDTGMRRLVASPAPQRILEVSVIQLLVKLGVVVICGGGGGVPVARGTDGTIRGVEAVVDKDAASTLLATEIGADQLLLLTDVPAVYADWPNCDEPIGRASPRALADLTFEPGTMGPKVAAACQFVRQTGRTAHIGSLGDVDQVLRGEAGTTIVAGREPLRLGSDAPA